MHPHPTHRYCLFRQCYLHLHRSLSARYHTHRFGYLHYTGVPTGHHVIINQFYIARYDSQRGCCQPSCILLSPRQSSHSLLALLNMSGSNSSMPQLFEKTFAWIVRLERELGAKTAELDRTHGALTSIQMQLGNVLNSLNEHASILKIICRARTLHSYTNTLCQITPIPSDVEHNHILCSSENTAAEAMQRTSSTRGKSHISPSIFKH